jgi:anti-sigma-K factor RskA
VSHPALACEECRVLLGGFVLDALEPAEADAVRAHLTTCAACGREHAQLAALPALLDTTADVEAEVAEPPAALEEAVVHGFVRDRRPPERPWLRRVFLRPVPVAIAAAAVAVVVTLAISAGLSGRPVSESHAYTASLQGLPPASTARASAKLASFPGGTRVRLTVDGLTPAPNAVYEMWCIRDDGTRTSAGTFGVDQSGHADVRLTTGARLGDYHRLSIERLAPRGPGRRVMTGSVEY